MFNSVDENTILSTINKLKNKSTYSLDNIANILIIHGKYMGI